MAIIFAMDESLKARLIGAAVLVAVAVILIPELLTGRGPAHTSAPVPGDRGTRTIVIDVPVSGATVSAPTPTPAPATAVEERGPGAIVPAQQSGQPAAAPETTRPGPAPTPVTTPAPAPAATVVDNRPGQVAPGAAPNPAPAASRPAAVPTATAAAAQASSPPAATPRGAWAVQVGAFGSTGAAAKVVNELSSAGFRAYVSPVQRGGKTLYRVRVGPEAERSRADALAASLKGRGLPATVVAND